MGMPFVPLRVSQPSVLPDNCFMHFNPLSPHDALKHHLRSLKTDFILLKLRGFRRKISMKLLPIHCNFFTFFTHFKSSLFTTSRELRQQFAACSG